jgi:hypothetical protein
VELITGNKFKKICHHSIDEFGFVRHSEPINGEILKVFVKIDYVPYFFSNPPYVPFILITHNGDLPIDDNYLKYLDNNNLIKWYGQNVMTHHPKLKSIPIGIANEKWEHGNETIFYEVMSQENKKEQLMYVNFDVNTNIQERNYCLSNLNKFNLKMSERVPFKKYLEDVSKSYFVISPNGNGIDCHKIWESLYLKTIPIVTQSINIDFYKHLPILIIKDWGDFNPSNYSIDLYNELWNNFDINNLSFENQSI